jgi:hypothetical protein
MQESSTGKVQAGGHPPDLRFVLFSTPVLQRGWSPHRSGRCETRLPAGANEIEQESLIAARQKVSVRVLLINLAELEGKVVEVARGLSMIRYRTIILLTVGMILGFLMAVSIRPRELSIEVHAQFAQTPNMCTTGGPIPTGWIQISETDNPNCTSPSGVAGRMMQLVNYAKDKPFATETVCSDAVVPSGWIVTSFSHNTQCAYAGSATNDSMIIMNLN